MNPKLEHLVNSIFNKLNNYKAKKLFLEKENLKKFIILLFKED